MPPRPLGRNEYQRVHGFIPAELWESGVRYWSISIERGYFEAIDQGYQEPPIWEPVPDECIVVQPKVVYYGKGL